MSTAIPASAKQNNRLLARLTEADRGRITPLLRPETLAFDRVLYEARGPIDHAYFPTGGVLSALTIMEDGGAIEVATVGNEGVVGPALAGGGKTSPHRMIVQIGGDALRIDSRDFEREISRSASLREILFEYQSAFVSQVSQSVTCNGLHRLKQRCCRWLLMSRDRVGSDELLLTHEYMAIMLGARRASVTEILRPLQDAGLIASRRGRITILDGAGLEARTCECYRAVRDVYDRLLGPPG